ncbi:MAG: glycosyltransferase family 4 protein [Mucilaginibacter sp.]
MPKKLMLLTLQTFSTTGGIQKMTRTLAYSINQIAIEKKWDFKTLSAYDRDSDLMPQYLPSECFTGFGVKRIRFVIQTIKEASNARVVILSHINLAIVGLLIKLFNRNCKIWLIAHGIEVWRPLSSVKKRLIGKCDKVICVSQFTKQQMMDIHQTSEYKCIVLNNAIDPFMQLPVSFEKPARLMEKYNLRHGDPVIYTLTRLAATEQYKGHEQVIKAISHLKEKFPAVKYILSGKYDAAEEIRINELIDKFGVAGSVILTGFIEEKDLPDHFLLADLFVLPSKKEGFGIVFIEAMACGLPVICGNADGSIDAIRNGELGRAVDVNDQLELEKAITESLEVKTDINQRKSLQNACKRYFNEYNYRQQLKNILLD